MQKVVLALFIVLGIGCTDKTVTKDQPAESQQLSDQELPATQTITKDQLADFWQLVENNWITHADLKTFIEAHRPHWFYEVCQSQPIRVRVTYKPNAKEEYRKKWNYRYREISNLSGNSISKRTGIVELDVVIVQLPSEMSTEEVVKTLTMCGLEPVDFLELRAIYEQYPDLELNPNIYGLGSVWQSSEARHVPCLYWLGKKIEGLCGMPTPDNNDNKWSYHDRFAATRK